MPTLPSRAHIETAHTAIAWLLFQIPGLVSAVRSLHSPLADTLAVTEAVARACQLRHSLLDSYVRETVQEHSWIRDCLADSTTSPAGPSLDFGSQDAFVLALRHYWYRMLICGLLQSLHRIVKDRMTTNVCRKAGVGNDYCVDLQAAEDDDVSAATAISQCLPYASKPDVAAMPLTALATVIPMEFSLGTWNRLLQRQEAADAPDYHKALRMGRWTLDRLHRIGETWRARRTDHERVKKYCDAFAGGPLTEDLCSVRLGATRQVK